VENEYVGSKACRVCHEPIYEAWRMTRHSVSVKTADEAKRAAYPLPKAAQSAGSQSAAATWNDLRFVFGGRKRIAYVDSTGQVLPTSFHHRRTDWSPFPVKLMECGPCHYTGFDPNRPNPRVPRAQGSWAELNIGCEACHGPGGRHEQTAEKADIKVDPSSRLCGTCHTRVGRVLPRDDDVHQTHDEVQVWNQDPHVTGMKFASQTTFCARCHSPFDGAIAGAEANNREPVFSEAKRGITCISCHNPHSSTDAAYRPERAYLKPPRPPRVQIFKGHDGDVTTDDFFELKQQDNGCVQCHSGADRIDLNHANAGCSDCHNTFSHNRTSETRILADAMRPRLTCRQCHADGDHLLTILFRDASALRPSYIHNLATLPAAFRSKYGFRPSARSASRAYPRSSAPPAPATREAPDAERRRNAPAMSDVAGANRAQSSIEFLQQGLHRKLSADPEIDQRQRAVRSRPQDLETYLDLATTYIARGARNAAADVVERALECPADSALAGLTPVLLRRSSIAGLSGAASSASAGVTARLHEIAAAVANEEFRWWLEGCLQLEQLRFQEAEAAFRTVAHARPSDADARFFYGLAQLGRGDLEASRSTLTALLKVKGDHVPARVALGIALLEKKQFALAERELRRAIREDSNNGTAAFVLAIGHLRQGVLPPAIDALRLVLTRDPQYLPAYFELAHATRLAGSPEEGIEVYRQIIARQPDHLDAHWELATLLKYLFDETMFRAESLRGAPPSASGLSKSELIAAAVDEARRYQDLALSEFGVTLRLRPGYPDAIRQVADLYRRSGRLREAADLFRSLATIQLDSWIDSYRLGTTLVQLGEYDRATVALERALAVAPSQGDIYAALGIAHVKAKRLNKGVAMLERAAVYLPFSPAVFTNLGAAYASNGAYDLARTHLHRALELRTFPLPRLYLTYTNLGLIELRANRPGAAIQAFENALHLAPDYARASELLAKTRLNLEARATYSFQQEGFEFNDLLEIFGEISTVEFEK
jgi:tetratricopeptide (TPR) repeat protein